MPKRPPPAPDTADRPPGLEPRLAAARPASELDRLKPPAVMRSSAGVPEGGIGGGLVLAEIGQIEDVCAVGVGDAEDLTPALQFDAVVVDGGQVSESDGSWLQ